MIARYDDVTVIKPTPFVLLKISRKEYISDTIKTGHIYMSLASYFRNLADITGKSLIYDIDECSHSRDLRAYLTDGEAQIQIFGDNPDTHMAINYKQCLYCLYSVYCHNSERIDYDTLKHTIPKELINSFPQGNESIDDYTILLFEFPHNIIMRINDELKKQDLNGRVGYINYDDHYYKENISANIITRALDAAFHKKRFYQSQQEYRIAVVNDENKPIDNFYIGALAAEDYTLLSIEKDKDLEIIVKFNHFEDSIDSSPEVVSVNQIIPRFV